MSTTTHTAIRANPRQQQQQLGAVAKDNTRLLRLPRQQHHEASCTYYCNVAQQQHLWRQQQQQRVRASLPTVESTSRHCNVSDAAVGAAVGAVETPLWGSRHLEQLRATAGVAARLTKMPSCGSCWVVVTQSCYSALRAWCADLTIMVTCVLTSYSSCSGCIHAQQQCGVIESSCRLRQG
jgi:hypothetical protein